LAFVLIFEIGGNYFFFYTPTFYFATLFFSTSHFSLGQGTLTFPLNVILIVLVVGLAVPFDFYAFGYTTTDSIGMAMPYDANATKVGRGKEGRRVMGRMKVYEAFEEAGGRVEEREREDGGRKEWGKDNERG
jgi:hypothetical protein